MKYKKIDCYLNNNLGLKIIKTSVIGQVDRESGERNANAIGKGHQMMIFLILN